jgi:plastocyanin
VISDLKARPRVSAAGPILIAVLAIGVLAGCTSAGPTATATSAVASAATASASASIEPSATAGPSVPADAIVVHVKDFSVDPSSIEHTGTTVTLDVINNGPTPHNITVRDASGTVLFATRDLRTGESEVVTAAVPTPGGYIVFCSLPGHESLGIKGTLQIR